MSDDRMVSKVRTNKNAALRRVRTVLENNYVKWYQNHRPRQVVSVVSVDNCVYARLKNDRWTSTQLCYGSKVDHFLLKSPDLRRVYALGPKRHRGNAAKAVRGLVALGLVSKEDGEVARLFFYDLARAKDKQETREELKRRARWLGLKLVKAR